jgi:quinoprotein glucose dehydrogenase
VAATVVVAAVTPVQPAASDAEWRSYHRDYGSTRYSPLAQITRDNVAQLTSAWTWEPDSTLGVREGRSQNTPLMVNGTLYFTAGVSRAVVAADPATGKTRWTWSMDESERVRVMPRRNSGRGVSYWSNPATGEERIYTVTPGFQLVALDAKTGKPIANFGTNGVVDLKTQLGVELDVNTAPIGNSSPPLVFENVVVIGPALAVGTAPPSMKNVPGRILAIDALTGKLIWRLNTIPQPGEFGVDTWGDSSWSYTGNTGAWAPMSLDERRGWIYLPIEAPTGDYYGGHRPGDNLFSSSVVCLDIRTGKRIWHYQTVHHDIWDYDLPTAPILSDIMIDGRRVEALVQITKQGFTFVLDRVTGIPVWPIEERPVPQSDLAGEKTSPTQPIPTKPPPFDRQGVSVDDLIDFTPALRAQAENLLKSYRIGPIYEPPSLPDAATGVRGTLSLPNSTGGANWEHGAFDPETGMLYVGSATTPSLLAMQPGGGRSDMNFIGALGGGPNIQGLSIIKPPYSRITALDLTKGTLVWTVPAGDTPDRIKNNAALQGLQIPRTGTGNRPVVLATRTLLFQGEGSGGGPKLYALDKATGAIVHEFPMGGAVTSSPMTYMYEGRQYVAFWVSNPRATLVSMALPR